jgi:hypothetical protein
LLTETPRFETTAGSRWDEWRSLGVLFLKRPDLGRAWTLARGAVRRVVKPGAYRFK